MIEWEQSWQTIGAVPMWCFLHSTDFTWSKANTFHMVFMIAHGTRYLLCMGKYMSVANGTIIHLYPMENLSLPCDKPWCRTGIYKNIPSETLLEITHIHDHIDSGVNKHKTKQWTQQWSWLQPEKTPIILMSVLVKITEPCGLKTHWFGNNTNVIEIFDRLTY